jgi:hypothetical protein
VTIADCEIRNVIFARGNPVPHRTAAWSFNSEADGEPAFGRLTVADAEVTELTLPMRGWTAPAAQLLSAKVRRSAGASCGILIETESGGRFLFGQADLVRRIADVTAAYEFAYSGPSDRWRRLVAPFHDLTWRPKSRSGGAMPAHELKQVTLLCSGSPGDFVDFAELELLRPRATGLEPDRCYVGGRVRGASAGVLVSARRKNDGTVLSQRTDQRGCFFFPGLDAGLYEIWSETGDRLLHDRRGKEVEVAGSMTSLVLEPS